jgi:hypothetical protein
MVRFRYNFKGLGPAWLTTDDGELVQYTIGRMLDLFSERVRQSLLARFPGSAVNDEAIDLVGDTRTFVRGAIETVDRFKVRIAAWLQPESLKSKGGYLALLTQVYSVLDLPAGTRLKIVTRNGLITQLVDGVFSYGTLSSVVTSDNNGFWVGAGVQALPGPFGFAYLVVENHPDWGLTTGLFIGDAGLWGGDLSGSTGELIGITGAKYEEIADLKALVREWIPLGINPVELLFNANPAQPFPETGVDSGTLGLPNYAAATPANLVRIPL